MLQIIDVQEGQTEAEAEAIALSQCEKCKGTMQSAPGKTVCGVCAVLTGAVLPKAKKAAAKVLKKTKDPEAVAQAGEAVIEKALKTSIADNAVRIVEQRKKAPVNATVDRALLAAAVEAADMVVGGPKSCVSVSGGGGKVKVEALGPFAVVDITLPAQGSIENTKETDAVSASGLLKVLGGKALTVALSTAGGDLVIANGAKESRLAIQPFFERSKPFSPERSFKMPWIELETALTWALLRNENLPGEEFPLVLSSGPSLVGIGPKCVASAQLPSALHGDSVKGLNEDTLNFWCWALKLLKAPHDVQVSVLSNRAGLKLFATWNGISVSLVSYWADVGPKRKAALDWLTAEAAMPSIAVQVPAAFSATVNAHVGALKGDVVAGTLAFTEKEVTLSSEHGNASLQVVRTGELGAFRVGVALSTLEPYLDDVHEESTCDFFFRRDPQLHTMPIRMVPHSPGPNRMIAMMPYRPETGEGLPSKAKAKKKKSKVGA